MYAKGLHKPAQSSSGHFDVVFKNEHRSTMYLQTVNSECPDHPVHVHLVFTVDRCHSVYFSQEKAHFCNLYCIYCLLAVCTLVAKSNFLDQLSDQGLCSLHACYERPFSHDMILKAFHHPEYL